MEEPVSQWTQPGWIAEVHEWIYLELERLGMETQGPIEQPHIRPWSTIMRISTREGVLHFKAIVDSFHQEARLTAALSRWLPDRIPYVLAADPLRNWLLMTDGGTPLRTVLQADGDITHWHRLLPLYAQMQQTLVGHVDEMLTLGVPDRRLKVLPVLYSALLEDRSVLRPDHPEGLKAEEYADLHALEPQFAALCEELAAYGLPETLQHDDLHDNNILFNEGHYTFFDWGDSCISHPFFTLLVMLGSAARTLKLEAADPKILCLRDLYLDGWSSYGSHSSRQAAFSLAYRIGMICRALTWHRLVQDMEGALFERYAGAVCGWLQEFLHPEITY
jgi:hypothetical protein